MPFPLPDFTIFTAATGSARDKTRHVYTLKLHLFKSKSNLKCFWLIYNNAMTAQTCTRLLEACKSAVHYQCKLCAYISWCLCWTVGHFPVSSKLSDSHSHTYTHTETRQEMASLYVYTQKRKLSDKNNLIILTKPRQTRRFSHIIQIS